MDNGDYSNDAAPVHQVDAGARESAAALSAVVKDAAKNVPQEAAMGVVPEVQRRQWRSFIAPLFPDARFLVKAGKLKSFPDMNSAFGQRDTSRDGDVWAVFGGGVLTTDDPDIIKWCLLRDGFHDDPATGIRLPSICVDANDRRAPAWANMKLGQQNIATREPSIDPEFDVDEMIYPDRAADFGTEAQSRGGGDRYLGAEQGGLVQTARDNAAAQNELAERAERARQEAARV